MNTEQLRAELLPCPFCGGSVSFHQDDAECRDGCHYIECKTCGMFDLSTAADPTNTVEDLGELRAMITPLWNRRAALQSQDRDKDRIDAERYRWLRADNAYFPEENHIWGGQELDAAIDHARRVEGEGE